MSEDSFKNKRMPQTYYTAKFHRLKKIVVGALLVTASCVSSESQKAREPVLAEASNVRTTASTSAALSPGTRPALRTAVTDSAFGTTIMRMTDPSMAPDAASSHVLGLRHEYARFP